MNVPRRVADVHILGADCKLKEPKMTVKRPHGASQRYETVTASHTEPCTAPRLGLHGRRVELGLPATLGPSGLGWLIGVLRDAGDRVGWLGGSTQASEWTFNQLSFCKGQKSFIKDTWI